jgi:hypothetical protein
MEWMESLLSILVSLRDFKLYYVHNPGEEYLSIIKSSPHLQYFSVLNIAEEIHCWKQLRGEWIVCDETKNPFGSI